MGLLRGIGEALGWLAFVWLTICWIVTIIVGWPLGILLKLLCLCRKDKKESRDPAFPLPGAEAQFKVAIIGAGWTGLQSAQQLLKRGISVEIFEQYDGVGGTWHPSLSYNGLHLHSPLYLNELHNFPHKKHDEKYLDRLSATETREYLNEFADFYGLRHLIHCNSKVTEIHHRSATRDATIKYVDTRTGQQIVKGPFDLVVHATFACAPLFPDISNRNSFKGEMMHSSEMKKAKFDELVSSNKKILVIGSNKSGSDCMIMFHRAHYKNVTWVFRKSYMFIRYNKLAHSRPNHRDIFNTIRGAFTSSGLLLSLLSNTAAAVFLRMIGFLALPVQSHFDFTKFHLGILDQEQFDILNQVPRVVGNPVTFTSTGLRMLDGTELSADVIICATGYTTGLLDILVTVDDQTYNVDNGKPLYQHLIVPDVSTLALASTAPYAFGPRRGVSLADHVWHYLHTFPSHEHMAKSAKSNLVSESAHVSALFQSKNSFIRVWLLFYLDLMRTGALSLSAFLVHAVAIFAGAWQTALRLNAPKKLRAKKLN
eukprot:c25750_g1_i1.p1 GENE.c25750_g1_i1~~c25750_g1_i1.p1  ORF type:complete len:550 (-),score=118.74 c25750_g1_i1:205-1821(-)